jgi:hypothetical protein
MALQGSLSEVFRGSCSSQVINGKCFAANMQVFFVGLNINNHTGVDQVSAPE